jgi:NTP pyrophosphatase (non-canonical NTP hydrolase)
MINEVVGRLFEEMSELTFEVCKNYFRGKSNKLLIAHEIADVWQAIENLVEYLDIEEEVRLAKKELKEHYNLRSMAENSGINTSNSK